MFNCLQELEEHLKWLDNWEKQVRSAVNEVTLRRDAEIKSEQSRISVRDKENKTKGHKKTKQERDEDKEAIKAIHKKYKSEIVKERSNFLSDSTSQGLRLTIHSTIGLSKFLLENVYLLGPEDSTKIVLRIEYVLTKKLNQDCLEVLLNE